MVKAKPQDNQPAIPRPPRRFDANLEVAERVVDRIMNFDPAGHDTWHRYAVRQVKAALDAASGRGDR